MLLHDKWYHVTFVITRFYLPLLSTNVKHPKFGFHVTSLCQGLHRSAGSGGKDPENQVVPSQHILLYLINISVIQSFWPLRKIVFKHM